MNFESNTANSENPFGNMLPFLMFSNDKEFDPTLLFLMNQNIKDLSKNPWIFYLLQKDRNNSLLPFLFMNNNFSLAKKISKRLKIC